MNEHNVYKVTIEDLLKKIQKRDNLLIFLQGYLTQVKREGIQLNGLDNMIRYIEETLEDTVVKDKTDETAK